MAPRNVTNPMDLRSPTSPRSVYLYTVPAPLQSYGIAEIGIIELKAGEELMATKRAQQDPMRLAFELAKESLRSVDGKPVSTSDGTSDAIWETMHPKIRNLIVSAYGDVHQPRNSELADFLTSRQVQVG